MPDIDLSYPPKGSYKQVIDTIVKDLFTAEEGRLGKNITELIKLNNNVLGRGLDGFLWNGDWFTAPGTPPSRGERKSLHHSLDGQMRAHALDSDMVQNDKQMIMQLIYKIMLASTSPQLLRDSLPNSVVNLLPGLKKIERIDQSGACFPPGSRDRREFDRIAPKIDQYAAGKFFY